jgi:flagellar biosynthesis/type III secretory pathway protein FliH
MDEREAKAYDLGLSDGYEAGLQKGFAEGFDAVVEQECSPRTLLVPRIVFLPLFSIMS